MMTIDTFGFTFPPGSFTSSFSGRTRPLPPRCPPFSSACSPPPSFNSGYKSGKCCKIHGLHLSKFGPNSQYSGGRPQTNIELDGYF